MDSPIDKILAQAKSHCDSVIKPNVDAWNTAGVWPRDASNMAPALGLTGLYAPTEWGGQSLSLGDGIRVYLARVSIASGCCSLIESALDTALAYARDRKMFKGRNLDLDGIQWMLGDVATDLKASRLLYRAVPSALGTDEGPVMAAHAKRFVSDAAVKATNTCTHVMGGMGLLKSFGVDRLSRLSQRLRIVGGATKISRVVIGQSLQKRAKDLPDMPISKGFGV